MSPLGKKAIKMKAPEEVMNLVMAVKHIVEKESKSSKKVRNNNLLNKNCRLMKLRKTFSRLPV